MRIRIAVFPVAGLGTRFLPATKTVPKEMLPIVDKGSIMDVAFNPDSMIVALATVTAADPGTGLDHQR